MVNGPAMDATPLLVLAVVAFSLLWTFSLVPFTLALVQKEREPRRAPGPPGAVRAALLGLNAGDRPYRLRDREDGRLALEWDVVDASWYELFARVKLSAVYKATLYLHEPASEVRCYESIRTGSWFIGFEGSKPVFRWGWSYAGGALNVLWSGLAYGITHGFPPRIGRIYRFSLDTVAAKREVEAAVRSVGWTFRSVPLPIEVTPWGTRLGHTLTPPFMRDWSRTRFWGALQLLAWAGIIGTILSVAPWTARNLGVLALVCGGILGVQGLIVGVWHLLERRPRRSTDRTGQG